MKPYDLEAVTKAFYERQSADRFPGRPPWEKVERWAKHDWRRIVSDVIECYERHVAELEEAEE